jgi:hypothetical protein
MRWQFWKRPDEHAVRLARARIETEQARARRRVLDLAQVLPHDWSREPRP